MRVPRNRPPARSAGPELLVLSCFEEFTSWLLQRTGRWPKSARFTITQRLENHALDVLEHLVVARWVPRARAARLSRADLLLERMRHLLRVARALDVCPPSVHEGAARALDETGRMIHGWRGSLRKERPRRQDSHGPPRGRAAAHGAEAS